MTVDSRRAKVADLVVNEVVLEGDMDGAGPAAARDDDIVTGGREAERGEGEATRQLDVVLLAGRGARISEITDNVFAIRVPVEDEGVVTSAALKHVVTRAPVEPVVPGAAV